MSDERNPLDWIAIADEDLAVAQLAIRRKKPLTDIASFHAQQCAEKYLKAMLVTRKLPFPKTHDLILLTNLCAQAGIFVGIDPKKLNTLSDNAVRARYPGAAQTLDEARGAITIAQPVRKFTRQYLNVK